MKIDKEGTKHKLAKNEVQNISAFCFSLKLV